MSISFNRSSVPQKPIVARIEFTIGKITNCKQHPVDPGMCILTVDTGAGYAKRIVAEIARYYTNSQFLMNQLCVVFTNMRPIAVKGALSEGMVMCVANDDKTALQILQPSPSTQIGEKLTLATIDIHQWKPDERVNISKKNSFWKKHVIEHLFTDRDGDMTYDGIKFITKSNGKPIGSRFKGAQIF